MQRRNRDLSAGGTVPANRLPMMSRCAFFATVAGSIVVALLTTSTPVHAQATGSVPERPVTAAEPKVEVSPIEDTDGEKRWYGAPPLIADGCAITLSGIGFAAAQADKNSGAVGVMVLTGYVGYALVAPVTHAVHGRWGAAVGSLGLRLGVPVLGALGSMAAIGPSGEGAWYGLAAGMLVAGILDATLLPYETVPVDTGVAAKPAKPAKIAWWPTGGPRKEGGFTLGLGATF